MYNLKYLNKKKILIAGGSGLLGANLTNILLKSNANVTSSYYKKKKFQHNKKVYKYFDFLNFNDCLKATKNKEIVFIVAVKASGMFNLNQNFFAQNLNNLKLRINLLEACKKNKVKKIIWVSSSTVYQPKKSPIKEDQLDLNLQPYKIYQGIGNSYRYLENLFMHYVNSHNMNIKIIRTTSIYGPFDNFDPNYSHVIPGLIKKIFLKGKFLKVSGNPKVIRDFVFASDLALACILILNKKFRGIVNFSSGIPITIHELSKKILKVSKSNKKIKFINKSISSASYRVLDNTKFNKLFKNFKRTDLNDGLLKTLNWFKKNEK